MTAERFVDAAEFRAWAEGQRAESGPATTGFIAMARQLVTSEADKARLASAEARRAELDEAYWSMIFRAVETLELLEGPCPRCGE